jgi:hypothetical protein
MKLVSDGARFRFEIFDGNTGYGVLLFETSRLKTLKTTVMALLTKDGLGGNLVQLQPGHYAPRPFWAWNLLVSQLSAVACRLCHLKLEMQRRTNRCRS